MSARLGWVASGVAVAVLAAAHAAQTEGGGARSTLGTQRYEHFERPQACGTCHTDFARQHEQAMMSQAYIHEWDEIEYFELAVPHARKEPKMAGIEAECNGCHSPLAYLAGDIPPKRPAEGTRANEGVSCDLCHTVTGYSGDVPVNFNWVVSPGKIKQGPRPGRVSPHHETRENPFTRSAEFCGTCHNEMNSWGLYVKSTQLEWKDGPHGKAGIVCQDCHMPPAAGRTALMGESLPDARQHLFHGAHDRGKLSGVIEVRIHPETREVEWGDPIRLTAVLVNAKAGHKVPSGSSEERVLWLDVTATDADGRTYHLPVDPKGFDGEPYTIASDTALAYQDIGDIQDLADFRGLKRDGIVPAGDRIFRLPYFDSKGRMTICQWNTASFGVDYRIAPLEAVMETFTWQPPDEIAEGTVTVTARVYYSRIVSSVAEFLKVPDYDWETVEISSHSTTFEVF